MTDVSANANPSNLAAVTGPVVDDGRNPDLLQPANRAARIADLALTGTYATDEAGIQAAVNGILAALIAAGIMKSA